MDLTAHPCFDPVARAKFARAHLPVAPTCNVQCNYCDRRFDCASESRPGITSVLLDPEGAANYVDELVDGDPSLRVIGIAGPGDPLASAAESLETLRLVRERHPELLLCLATNGLSLPKYVEELAALAVSHVTVTVNAVDPEVGARMYRWVKDGTVVYRGREAAERVWRAQAEGIRALAARNILVKINSIVVPGVNDHHIAEVARETAALGAARFNCLPLYPVAGTPFGNIEQPSRDLMHRLRNACKEHLPQMEHCTRCRADAVGRLGAPQSEDNLVMLRKHASQPLARPRPYIAVASEEGLLVNQHLGEAERFLIFGRHEQGYQVVDERVAPRAGRGRLRWRELAMLLSDCRTLVTSGAGPRPAAVLAASGLEIAVTEGMIEDALDALEAGRPLPKPSPKDFRCTKGDACSGTGDRCG